MATNTGETSARISKPTDNCTNEANHFNSVNSIKMIIEFYAMSSFINCWSVAQKGGRIEMYKDRPRLWQKLTVDRYIFHCRSFIRSCVIFIFHTCAYFNPHNWQWCLKQSWRHARTIRNMANWKMKRKKNDIVVQRFNQSRGTHSWALEAFWVSERWSDDVYAPFRN